MNENFRIELVSDLDCEGMVVDVSFKDKMVFRLNYDEGIDRIEMTMIGFMQQSEILFPLQDFLEAIERAKKILIKCFEEDRKL